MASPPPNTDTAFLHLRDWNPVGLWFAGNVVQAAHSLPRHILVGLLDNDNHIFCQSPSYNYHRLHSHMEKTTSSTSKRITGRQSRQEVGKNAVYHNGSFPYNLGSPPDYKHYLYHAGPANGGPTRS